jgi:hypothetical protein
VPDRRFNTPKYTPKPSGGPQLSPIRPASIFLMSSGALLAPIVQQPHANFFPNGMWSIEAQRVGFLNLDSAKAA